MNTKPLKYVWQALHNPMIEESTSHTISLHRTRKGAEKVIKASKVYVKERYKKLYRNHRVKPRSGWRGFHWWGVNKIEIED